MNNCDIRLHLHEAQNPMLSRDAQSAGAFFVA